MPRRPPLGGRRPNNRQKRQVESAMSKAAGQVVNLSARAANKIINWITGGSGREPTRREIEEAAEELVPSELVREPGTTAPRSRPSVDMNDGEVEIEAENIGYTFFAPNSTNVYSYRYDDLNENLFVTYRVYRKIQRGSDQRPNEPGVTYQYFSVPPAVWNRFRSRAQADKRGGEEVWDELRQRGTIFGTQYAYSLVEAQVSDGKTYVPRRATKKGFKRRAVLDAKRTRRGQPVWDENTLPETDFRGKRRRGNGRQRGS